MSKKTLSFGITNVKFAESDKTNWMTFSGTCAFIDTPSDGIPSGTYIDKPVAFPREEVDKSINTMVDMGVNCMYPDNWSGCPDEMFQGHDSRNKIGVVKVASVNGNEVQISGGLWSYDFYDICEMIKVAKDSLGWSVEILMNLEDKGDYYDAVDIEFTGVCLMWADKSAFKKTYLLAQERLKQKGGNKMNKEELQAMFAEFMSQVTENINGVKSEFVSQIETLALNVVEVKDGFAKLEAEKVETERLAKEKLELEEQARVEAEEAEKARLELEAQEKLKAPQRQTLAFGVQVGKFEGANDAEKAIISDTKLSPGEQFRKLIDLQLESK